MSIPTIANSNSAAASTSTANSARMAAHGRQLLNRWQTASEGWIDATLDLAAWLWEVRQQYPSNQDFSAWLIDNELDDLGKNARAALINMGRNLALTRGVLEGSLRYTSAELIWEHQIKPRLPSSVPSSDRSEDGPTTSAPISAQIVTVEYQPTPAPATPVTVTVHETTTLVPIPPAEVHETTTLVPLPSYSKLPDKITRAPKAAAPTAAAPSKPPELTKGEWRDLKGQLLDVVSEFYGGRNGFRVTYSVDEFIGTSSMESISIDRVVEGEGDDA